MKKTKRFISTFLALAMAFSIIPMNVFAKESKYCYESSNVVKSCKITAQAMTDGVISKTTGGTVVRKNTEAKYFECGGGVWTFGAVANEGYRFVGWDTSLSWDKWKIVFGGKDHWEHKSETNPYKINDQIGIPHINNRSGNKAFHIAKDDKTHMAVHHVGCGVQAGIKNVHYNIIAKFERIPNPIHTVRFEKNSKDANEPSYKSFKIEKYKSFADVNKSLPTCTRDGYEFGGWYTNKKCTAGKEFLVTTPVHNSMKVYAKWVKKVVPNKTYGVYHYSLKATGEHGYDTEFSSNPFNDTVITDKYINSLAKDKYGEYEGYELWGYKPNDDTQYKIATKDDSNTIKDSYDVSEYNELRIHLDYKATYTITFDSNGGTYVNPTEDVEHGKTISEPIIPTKDNYDFVGWYKDENLNTPWNFLTDTVNDDITLYAKWSVANKTYGVFHYSFRATENDSYDTEFSSEPFSDTVITKDDINSFVNEDKYGEYEGYDLWGYKPNDNTQYKIATKDDSSTIKDSYDVSEYKELRIHLSYKVEKATVTFNKNSNRATKPTYESITIEAGTSIGKALPTTQRTDGYKFDGWYTNKKCTAGREFLDTSVVNDNMTVYAKWVKDDSQTLNYTVEYYKDGEKYGDTCSGTVFKYAPRVSVSSITTNIPAGYKLSKPTANRIKIKKDNQIIKVYYVKDESQYTTYTVEYYKDSIADENKIISTAEKEIIIGSTVTLTQDQLNENRPIGYGNGEVQNSAVITEDNRIIKVLYTKDDTQKLDYTIEYYKDGELYGTVVNKTVPMHSPTLNSISYLDIPGYNVDKDSSTNLPFTVTEDNNVIRVYYVKDESATQQYWVEYFINGNPVEKLNYTDYVHLSNVQVNSVKNQNSTEGYYSEYLSNCVLDDTHEDELPFTVTTGDNANQSVNTIHVYYKTVEGDIINVMHNYFLNGVLQSHLTTNNNVEAPDNQTDVITDTWQKIKNGYHFTGVVITGILKDMFVKPVSETQLNINTLDDLIKDLRLKLIEETQKVDDGEALLEEYNSLTSQLKELSEEDNTNNENIADDSTNKETSLKDTATAQTEEETSSKPQEPAQANIEQPAQESSNEETSSEVTAPAKTDEETSTKEQEPAQVDIEQPAQASSSQETSSEDTAPAKTDEDTSTKAQEPAQVNNEQQAQESSSEETLLEDIAPAETDEDTPLNAQAQEPAQVNNEQQAQESSSEETLLEDTAPAETDEDTEDTLTVDVDPSNAIVQRMDEIESLAPNMIAVQKQINEKTEEKQNLEELLSEENDNDTDEDLNNLPEKITVDESTFKYDERYNYTVTFKYSKTVSTKPHNPSTGGSTDYGNGSSNVDNNTDDTVEIPDQEVPLAPLPDDIVTIVDEKVPLGKLPKSGGMQAGAIGATGIIALLLSAILKLRKKED